MKPITELKEMQSIELDIMNVVHNYCIKNNIPYCLSYGTLIGAIRHDGFIPWDDDIDIFIPRKEYERFCSSFNKDNSNSNYELVNHTTPVYFGRPMSKVIDNRTYLVENEFEGDDPIGVFVDIWPLDGLPDNKVKMKFHRIHAEFLRKLLVLRIKKTSCMIFPVKILHYLIRPISSKWITNRLDSVIKKYSYDNSNYVTSYLDPYHGLMNKEWFSKFILHKFEDSEFMVPSGYDSVLRSLYGDYMQLPPVDKQIPHHVVSTYWK